jgi:uncharacterized protein (TIGR02996 family)
MTLTDNLLRSIISGDDTAKLAYADLLEEQGNNHCNHWRQPYHDNNIIELLPWQDDLLDVWIAHWIDIGLATGKSDKPLVQQLISEAYQIAKLQPPNKFIWLSSPYQGTIKANSIDEDKNVRAKIWVKVWDKIWDKIWAEVRDKVWDKIWVKVRAEVKDKIRDKVWDKVRAEVRAEVRYNCCYGSQDASWLSYYSYILHVFGVKDCEELIPLTKLACHVGWWFPFENTCIVTERPSKLVLKDDEVEIEYSDGFKVGQ